MKPPHHAFTGGCGGFGVFGSVRAVSDELDRLLEGPDVQLTDEPVFDALRKAAKRGLIKPPPPVDETTDPGEVPAE